MPFDGSERAAPAAQAVRMLDLMEHFFAGGKKWGRGAFADAKGRRCMVGAIQYLRDKHHMTDDRTMHYLHRAIGEYYAARGMKCPRFAVPIASPQKLSAAERRVIGFNDQYPAWWDSSSVARRPSRKRGYKDVLLIIRRARELAREAANAFNPARHARRDGGVMGTPAYRLSVKLVVRCRADRDRARE